MDTSKLKDFYAVAEPDIGTLEEEYLLDAFRSGWISSLGSYIARFEEEFSSFCDAPYGISVSNGTTALHLSLVVLGVGPGDEVILPSLTFVATAAAIRHAGATPIFVDCEPEIGTISPDAVKHALTNKTKAIIAVHLYGHPADMGALTAITKEQGIYLIEDAAEAHGACYRGRRVGSMGDIATFSFYGNKVLTTGEGGMVVTGDGYLNKRLKFLRDHAMDENRRYWHPEVGYNYRLTNLQASIGVAQLQRFNEISGKRENVLKMYKETAMEARCNIQLNPRKDWASPTMWLVSALLPDEIDQKMREQLIRVLRDKSVDTRPYFIPLHQLPPYIDCTVVGNNGAPTLPVTESLSSRGLNLPSSTHLNRNDVNYISELIATIIERI